MPDISIIIPVYNTERYLEECVNSLYRQGLQKEEFEVILVDDGSTDNSLSIANKLAYTYGNIKVFHQENQGQAVARNLGLDVSRGMYVMFVDSDDYMIDNSVKCLYDTILSLKLDVVFGLWYKEKPNGDIIVFNSKGFNSNLQYSGEQLALNYPVFGSVCGGIYLKSVFDGVRFECGFTHEDSELCFRLFPRLKKVMQIDRPVYFYRFNPSSTDRATSRQKLLRNIESDAIISSRILKYVYQGMFNKSISGKYKRIANSMTIAYFKRLKRYKLVSTQDFDEKIDVWTDWGIYPINGRCNSLKSTIISQLFNYPFILKKYLCN